ncbi:MAG: DUF6141 family protein [Bacteroidota bacterium]|nr:DUF6141 family protein [Bacteroidota bacterium]
MRYKETQEIKYVWLWIGLLVAFLFVFILLMELATTKTIRPETIAIFSSLSVLMTLFFKTMKLTTIIDEFNISYKLFPFHLTFRKIPWMLIERCEVRTYNPMGEYGGWGLKYGRKSGKAINLSGNKGLQLYLKTGKKILIGTQQPERLEQYLKMIGKV